MTSAASLARVWEGEVIVRATMPDGRLVVIDAAGWNHVLSSHPEMAEHLEELVAALEMPYDVEPCPDRVDRLRVYGFGAEGWIRAVIEWAGAYDRLVTAFIQQGDPRAR